jgi:hypothetical protein
MRVYSKPVFVECDVFHVSLLTHTKLRSPTRKIMQNVSLLTHTKCSVHQNVRNPYTCGMAN